MERVDLPSGWSLRGWTADSVIADASATEGEPIARILAWDAGAAAWASYEPGGPAGPAESDQVRLGQGLWLRVDDPAGVQWRRPSFAAARVQELLAGWNLVMWSGPSGTPVAEAVRPIADALRSLHAWDADAQRFRTYAPDRPADLNDARTLDNGEAFWLLLDEAAAWPQPSAGTPPVARSVAQARAAAVFLKQGGREGTGFLVGETRIITAAHVVQNGHTVQVHFPGGEERTALVVAADGPLDIAVLEVSGVPAGVTRLDWETAASPEPATPVWSWGFPLAMSSAPTRASAWRAAWSPRTSATSATSPSCRRTPPSSPAAAARCWSPPTVGSWASSSRTSRRAVTTSRDSTSPSTSPPTATASAR